jgi:F-type H+-transporting ATPase subunit a
MSNFVAILKKRNKRIIRMKKFMVPFICLFVIMANISPVEGATTKTEESAHETTHHDECSCHHEEKYDPGASAFHHIGDANAFHLFGDYYLPLPCLLYAPENGFKFLMSNDFHMHHHGSGSKAIDGYVMVHGSIMRVNQEGFPMKGEVEVSCYTEKEAADGKVTYQVVYDEKCYNLDKKTSYDGGIMGGGISSFYDFGVTKNVFTMILAFLILFFLFRKAAVSYITRKGQAPKGVQAVIEPLFEFIRNEVAIPFLGSKYEKYLTYLMSIFFFIL